MFKRGTILAVFFSFTFSSSFAPSHSSMATPQVAHPNNQQLFGLATQMVEHIKSLFYEPQPVTQSNKKFRLNPIAPSDQIALPKEISDCKNITPYQLKSAFQVGPSCGWYTTCNAKAVDDIINNNEQLTAQNIKTKVVNIFIPYIKDQKEPLKKLLGIFKILEGMQTHHMVKFATHIGVKSCQCIWWDGCYYEKSCVHITPQQKVKKDVPVYHAWDHDGTFEYGTNPHSFFHSLKSEDDENLTHIFLCGRASYGAHVALLTLAKEDDGYQKPKLLYLESNNAPLDKPYGWHVEYNQHVREAIHAMDAA